MSEPTAPAPANCDACHQPLGEQHYRFGPRAVCLNCAQQLYAFQQHNRFAAGPWFVGLFVGVVVALICGAAWAAIAIATKYEIGIIAVGVGLVVSTAVVKVAGNRRGRAIQIITIACSILGIFAGKGLLMDWMIMKDPQFAGGDPIHKALWLGIGFVMAPINFFSPFDVLWYLLAIRAAWQIGKAPPAQLHGPYQTAAPPAAAGMQFDVVEPMPPPGSGVQE